MAQTPGTVAVLVITDSGAIVEPVVFTDFAQAQNRMQESYRELVAQCEEEETLSSSIIEDDNACVKYRTDDANSTIFAYYCWEIHEVPIITYAMEQDVLAREATTRAALQEA